MRRQVVDPSRSDTTRRPSVGACASCPAQNIWLLYGCPFLYRLGTHGSLSHLQMGKEIRFILEYYIQVLIFKHIHVEFPP